MDFKNLYLKFKPTYKDYYLKNNNIDGTLISTEELFNLILRDVDIVLSVLKISPIKKGYAYWRDAILISIFSEKDHLSICKDIYPIIAQKYNKSTISIERAMRLCFESVMYNLKNEDNYIISHIKDYLTFPHNSELLIKLAELVVSSEFRFFKTTFHK